MHSLISSHLLTLADQNTGVKSTLLTCSDITHWPYPAYRPVYCYQYLKHFFPSVRLRDPFLRRRIYRRGCQWRIVPRTRQRCFTLAFECVRHWKLSNVHVAIVLVWANPLFGCHRLVPSDGWPLLLRCSYRTFLLIKTMSDNEALFFSFEKLDVIIL